MNEVIQIFRAAMEKGAKMEKYDNLERIVGRLMDSLQYSGEDSYLTMVTYSYLEKVSYSYYRRLKVEKELIVEPLRSIIQRELILLNEKTAEIKDTWPDNYGWFLRGALNGDRLTHHLSKRSQLLMDKVGCGFSHVYKLDDGQIAIEESLREPFDQLITDPHGDIELLAHENINEFLQHIEEWKDENVDTSIINWKIGENHYVD